MKQAFISYSRKDKTAAIKLKQDLEFRGLPTWLDLDDIPAGTEWPAELEEAIEQCPYFLLLLSPDSVSSDYTRHEYTIALNKKKYIIPVMLRMCELPKPLAHIQYVDLRDYDRGLQKIIAVFPKEAFTEGLTVPDILKNLKSSDPEVRAMTLTLIQGRGLTETVDAVIEAMCDPDRQVRASAAWALDRLSDPRSVGVLIKAMYDQDSQVRSNAGWALVHMGAVVVPNVTQVLRDSKDEHAREMAYLVLSHIATAEAQDAINKYWK